MNKGNPRRSQPRKLVNELVETGLLTKREATSYVYFEIMDDPEREAETIFDIAEGELADEIENAREMISAARRTIEVEKSVEGVNDKIDALIEAGLLAEEEAKVYVHSERVGESNVADVLDIPSSVAKDRQKRAEDNINKAYEVVSFLHDYTGIQIY